MRLWLLFLSYLGKSKAKFEVLDFCLTSIKELDWVFKKVVNNALIRVAT